MKKSVIRRATTKDIPSIVHVSVSSVAEGETKGFAPPSWSTYSTTEELGKAWAEENRLRDGSEIIVAEKSGKVIGFIVFKGDSAHMYIDNIDIIKDEQRRGVGRALVEYVENVAATTEHFTMKTDTTENAKGIPWKSYGFWTRLGYKDTGERLPAKWGFKVIPFVKELGRPEGEKNASTQD